VIQSIGAAIKKLDSLHLKNVVCFDFLVHKFFCVYRHNRIFKYTSNYARALQREKTLLVSLLFILVALSPHHHAALQPHRHP
jgi:hypothetical protein